MNKRKFLKIVGGGAVVAVAGGATAFLTTRDPLDARQPWTMAGAYEEPRRRALSYAILAPNPHNRQPWMVDLSVADEITLYVDTERLLPHTDPFNRQITIGLGCFLELLRMAAAEDGYSASATLFPDGSSPEKLDARPVARITFRRDPSQKPDPLFAHTMNRRSLKEPFDLTRPVSASAIDRLKQAAAVGIGVGTTIDGAEINRLRNMTARALAIEIETPRTYQESVDLFRIGKAEVNASPDGIAFTGPLFETLGATGVFTRETALDTTTSTYAYGISAVMENAETAMGYIWLTTKTNGRVDQINAGRDWLRVNLAATAQGLATQPLSQILQEYPEMATLYEDVHRRLAPEGHTIQMLGRLGYAKPVPPAPRWPLDAKIVHA